MLEKMENKNDKRGEMLADKITTVIGSWSFIISQSIILGIWIFLNIAAWVYNWDPYPFILLNLALSFQAAYAAPVIMMSQNRAAARDRKKAELDLMTDLKAEREISEIQEHLKKIEKEKLDRILKILEEKI